MRFDRLGVFTYSAEDGTPAARFEGQIDEAVKEARRDELMAIMQWKLPLKLPKQWLADAFLS